VLTLGQAAKLTGTSKTTLTRAIRAGRLSAIRREDGGYQIDPAELARVYTVTPATPETGAATGDMVHRAIPESDGTATPHDPEVMAQLAALDAEIKGLKALLAEVQANRDELRADRDDWRGRAERLLTDQRPASIWRRMFG
jgi:excisionase family DNA binding protein